MTTPVLEVTEPCVLADLDEAAYHRDPVAGGSLSSGGARLLLEPGGPAKFDHARQHPRTSSTKAFDLGHAVHTEILGVGAGIKVVDHDSWRTKAAQNAKKEAYAAGQTPVLADDYWRVRQMASAALSHPAAGPLLTATGDAEQSLFWTDPDTGMWCRARHDKPIRDRNGRLVIVDLKSCEKADERSIQRSVANYGYHQQDQWYRRAAVALDLDGDPGFVFVFVEKDPPHLVSVKQLDAEALEVGRRRNNAALALYAECRRTGVWPATGYGDDFAEISLPPYYPTQEY
jgi:hypothetical protein